MEVTSTNFQDVLAELEEVLPKASFISIDGEFTGLNSGPDASTYDTPAQYYSKLRSGSMDFLLVQFGLSVFTLNNETLKYNHRTYNFYVFPRPRDRAAPDHRFMCQASSISFLGNHGFDFNKLFNLGIPYLSTDEKKKLVKRMEDRQKAREEQPEAVPIPEDLRPQIEEICTKIEEFISSDAESLTIDRCNAFVRRLVHQEARQRWPGKLRLEGKRDLTGYFLVVEKSGTKEEEEQKDTERKEQEKLDIQNAVGFSELLNLISDSGKLIVGHNMLLDICHVIHKFLTPLPQSYREFKSLVHCFFPRILDTKIICQSQQFKENVTASHLNGLLETISKPPFSLPEVESVDGRCYATTADKCHEAGYDAYITGLCFITLANYLGTQHKPPVSLVLADSPLLDPFLNKLLIARLRDIPHIDLVGNDPNPNRDHVFHLTFPKEWKQSDITQLFSPFGGGYVSWLSDTTAFVALHRRDQANSAARALCKKSDCKVVRYRDYQTSLKTTEEVEDRKRKLPSLENAVPAEGESSPASNGANRGQDDEGWELAIGKRRRKRRMHEAEGASATDQNKVFKETNDWS